MQTHTHTKCHVILKEFEKKIFFKYCLPRKLSNQSIKWRRKRMNLFDGGIEIVTPKKHTQISTGTSQYEEHFNCIQHFAFVLFVRFLWVWFLFGFFPGRFFSEKKFPKFTFFSVSQFPCRLYGWLWSCWWWTNGKIDFENFLGWLAWMMQTQNTCKTHKYREKENNKNKIHKFNDDVLNTHNTDFFL